MKQKTIQMGKTIEFHGKASKMSDKIIIIVPKEYHKEFQPLLGKVMKFKGEVVIDS
jgi:hypothetical protein